MFSRFTVLLVTAAALPAAAATAPTGTVISPSDALSRAEKSLPTNQTYMRGGPGDRAEPGDDRTLAPYLYVAGGDPDTERLPLKETSAEVQIAGAVARVKARQVFANGGQKPIEAVYVFPASTRAAVHGMRMRIGQRTIEAKIDRKADAREAYQAAQREGKRASLLEQERPNVFTMSVANVMPGDRIEVELSYSELLVPTDAVYEFVYPTVVGPRYGGGADPQKDKWIASPYLPQGTKETHKFDIDVQLETAIPIKDLSSPSHPIDARYTAPGSAHVRLAQTGPGNANKDYILRYRLAGDKVETGLLLWEGQGEKFFALMMEPPARPTDAQIPAREYVFLMDVSGSMHGFPLETAKTLMRNLLGQLRPTDWFNIALFSGASFVMSPEGSVPATKANIQLATELVGRQSGGGGTELMGGLRACYGIPRRGDGVSRTVVVVTDGYVGVEAQAFKFIRDRLDEANLFAFGIGNAVNRALIEGMARAGQGEPFVVLRPEKAAAEAEKLRAYIQYPVLTDIAVAMKGFSAYEVSPAKVPDLMARRPIVVFGKYQGEPAGRIEVSGMTGGRGRFQQAIEVRRADVKEANAPLRALWARKWVESLDDQRHLSESKELGEAITSLGLSYSLLTSFTSFVAVDSQVANRTGQSNTVAQPLPLPEGVSNHAVGNAQGLSLGIIGTQGAMGKRGGGSGQAYGVAGGGLGGRVASAPSIAPGIVAPTSPSAPPPASRPAPAKAKRLSRADMEADEKAEAPAAEIRLLVVDVKAARLGDLKPLAAKIDEQLATAPRACRLAEGTYRLRLTVDGAGRVVKVEVLSGDASAGACLAGKLERLTTGTRAQGGGTGVYELTVKALRLR